MNERIRNVSEKNTVEKIKTHWGCLSLLTDWNYMDYGKLEHMTTYIVWNMGRDSVVRLSTGWMVQGIKSLWGQDFPHSSRLAVWLPVQWLSGLFPRGKAAGSWNLSPIPPTVEVKERVELYFYPLWVFMACYKMNFTFTFSFTFHIVWYSIVFVVMVC
jgi:hypothetical protein